MASFVIVHPSVGFTRRPVQTHDASRHRAIFVLTAGQARRVASTFTSGPHTRRRRVRSFCARRHTGRQVQGRPGPAMRRAQRVVRHRRRGVAGSVEARPRYVRDFASVFVTRVCSQSYALSSPFRGGLVRNIRIRSVEQSRFRKTIQENGERKGKQFISVRFFQTATQKEDEGRHTTRGRYPFFHAHRPPCRRATPTPKWCKYSSKDNEFRVG